MGCRSLASPTGAAGTLPTKRIQNPGVTSRLSAWMAGILSLRCRCAALLSIIPSLPNPVLPACYPLPSLFFVPSTRGSRQSDASKVVEYDWEIVGLLIGRPGRSVHDQLDEARAICQRQSRCVIDEEFQINTPARKNHQGWYVDLGSQQWAGHSTSTPLSARGVEM